MKILITGVHGTFVVQGSSTSEATKSMTGFIVNG
jgi:hypothetical protein